uniref:receptor-like protein EIX2 n=1 Tax=Erigeron canadensis TaxID=72917 RepID=UPI001CB92FC6|nr:receptor-like protein EIX2 [Erigeron canadensis]
MSERFSFCYLYSCYLCFLVATLFQSCLSNQNFDDVLCLKGERQALLQFKDGLVDETDRLASWVGEASDCCRWAGIVCDNFTGHVHQIHLPGFDGHCQPSYIGISLAGFAREVIEYRESLKQVLRGDLSPSLLQLKQLRRLDLSCNDFEGIQVPSFIGSLANLNYLNLSNSNFGGIIPHQLGNLSELHVLSLGFTFFVPGKIISTSMSNMKWLSSLCMLQHLDMSGVDLSEATNWLQVITKLPSLVELHLSNTQLPNIYPHYSSLNITSLSLLDLSSNNFNSLLPQWIFSITSLVSLDLSWCSFLSPLPSNINSFHNLTSLKLLHVSGNDFMTSPVVLKEISSIGSNLISLDIHSCGFSSSSLRPLQNLTSLLRLGLSYNYLNDAIPRSLCNLCKLKDIDLSGNDYSNITITYLLESLFKCESPRLESLSISNSRLSASLPDQLGEDNVTCTIPNSIGRLSFLRSLDLNENQICGSIPYSIGQLTSLKVLHLSVNRISGRLPDSIGHLSSLEVLRLSSNIFSGSLPDSIGRLSSLEMLDLSNNRLNGSLPHGIGQLSKLGYLDFSNNSLNGVVTEDHFTELVALKHLSGTGSNITLRPRLATWIPPFQLNYLYLSSWVLGPQFPLWLQLQRNLLELDISNTRISSPIPASFWRLLPKLTFLDISQNHISGTFSSNIPATLQILDLSFNEFRGKLPSLSNGSELYFLDLSNNFFTGSLHHLLCSEISDSLKLTTALNLGNNSLSGVIPECWENWQNLIFLNMENNNLSGWIPATLGLLSQLMLLNLRGNMLSGRLPASLMNLTNLEILQLGRNELVGSIPAWFGSYASFLKILNLRSNNFHGDIPHELCYLQRIQILELADNNLSGNIPGCFNNFSVLSGKEVSLSGSFVFFTYNGITTTASDYLVIKGQEYAYSTILDQMMMLDLSSNYITGHIPSELMTLQELNSLNLSRNQLTGRIPEKIGDMKSIESFDVSLNKLSGELPMSLSSLTFLSSFNVSYNNLSGRIPSSTQFQTFQGSSFFGNKLCGVPLTNRCAVEVPAVEVPDIQDHKEDNGSQGMDWGLIISILIGILAGFWIVVAPLIVSRSWKIAYFHFWSKLGSIVCEVIHKYCKLQHVM